MGAHGRPPRAPWQRRRAHARPRNQRTGVPGRWIAGGTAGRFGRRRRCRRRSRSRRRTRRHRADRRRRAAQGAAGNSGGRAGAARRLDGLPEGARICKPAGRVVGLRDRFRSAETRQRRAARAQRPQPGAAQRAAVGREIAQRPVRVPGRVPGRACERIGHLTHQRQAERASSTHAQVDAERIEQRRWPVDHQDQRPGGARRPNARRGDREVVTPEHAADARSQ